MARSSYAGTGLFKSTDSGQRWQDMGLGDTYHITRVLIDPYDPGVVYVAAIGHNYSYNEQRGLFKTIDRGKTWISLCNWLPTTAVHDLVVHPRENELVIGTHGRSVYILEAETIKKPPGNL